MLQSFASLTLHLIYFSEILSPVLHDKLPKARVSSSEENPVHGPNGCLGNKFQSDLCKLAKIENETYFSDGWQQSSNSELIVNVKEPGSLRKK